MTRFVRENSLSLAFGLLFVGAVVGQAIAGYADFNNEQLEHGASEVSFGRFITSASFGAAVLENWQSEYLQFALYILLTIYLVQRGSPESKKPGEEGRESEEKQQLGRHAGPDSPRWARAGGVRAFLLSNSLLLAMAAIWIGCWTAQSVTGWRERNDDLLSHERDPLSWVEYIGSADFWERTLQNWQSEFLAVGSMAILAVYLRQRGSPESKPVGAPHHETAETG